MANRNKNALRGPQTRKTLVKRAVLILLLVIVAGSISYPKAANWVVDQTNNLIGTKISYINYPTVLGLDLSGGTHLEYVADLSKIDSTEKSSAMEGVRDVIERRVNQMGVSEPSILATQDGEDWRLSVELAGVQDINKAIDMIGATPILEFRVENTETDRALTEEEKTKLSTENTARLAIATDALSQVQSGKSFDAVAKDLRSKSAFVSEKTDLGWITSTSTDAKLFEALQGLENSKVSPAVIDGTDAYVVARADDRRASGKEMKASHILIQWKGASNSSSSSTKEEALKKIQEIKSKTTKENFRQMAMDNSQEPGAYQSGGDLGWFATDGIMVEPFQKALNGLSVDQISDVVETAFGYHLIFKTGERDTYDVKATAVSVQKMLETDIVDREPYKRTELTGKQLKRAGMSFNQQTGSPEVTLQFDDAGTKLFAELTKNNIGKTIAIYLDGSPISMPTVNQEIPSGEAEISGSFTVMEAKVLAQRLQSGALPVPIELVAQQSIGPMLGQQSINDSMRAGLYGFLFVILFMIVVYRLPGLLSAVSLGCYAVLVFAVYKLVPVTLSLSGIAGFILSLGMAVDANVLIFERMKEEFKTDKTTTQAIDEAFKRAWSSIWDGNITTLIVCVVLYLFTSSLIRGFALTLGIGILASMFSAVVISKILLKLVAHPKFVEKMPWFFLKAAKKHE
jgi:protein-export membrane protein SecD